MNPAKREFVFPTAITFALFALLAFFGTRRAPVLGHLAAAALAPAPLPPSVALTPPETSADSEPGSAPVPSPQPVRLPEPPAPLTPTGITVPTLVPITTAFTPGVVPIPPGNYGPAGVGEGPGGIATASMLDSIPRALAQPPPAYPYGAKAAQRSGQVTVEFWVDTRGLVHDPRAVSSTAYEFEEPAVHAVSRWRFEPGRKDGRIVSFRMAVPLKFTIEP